MPTLKTLVTFNGGNGYAPTAGLIVDTAGDLFGTTTGGGVNGDCTVFEISQTATGYATAPTAPVTFDITDGELPTAGLIADAAGDLFGTTQNDGPPNNGLAGPGAGCWIVSDPPDHADNGESGPSLTGGPTADRSELVRRHVVHLPLGNGDGDRAYRLAHRGAAGAWPGTRSANVRCAATANLGHPGYTGQHRRGRGRAANRGLPRVRAGQCYPVDKWRRGCAPRFVKWSHGPFGSGVAPREHDQIRQ